MLPIGIVKVKKQGNSITLGKAGRDWENIVKGVRRYRLTPLPQPFTTAIDDVIMSSIAVVCAVIMAQTSLSYVSSLYYTIFTFLIFFTVKEKLVAPYGIIPCA